MRTHIHLIVMATLTTCLGSGCALQAGETTLPLPEQVYRGNLERNGRFAGKPVVKTKGPQLLQEPVQWEFMLTKEPHKLPFRSDDVVYMLSDDGKRLTATRAGEQADVIWWFESESPIISMPAISQGIIVFCTHDVLYAVDAKSGRIIWKYQAKGKLGTGPAIHGDMVYVGDEKLIALCLQLTTGDIEWQDLDEPPPDDEVTIRLLSSLAITEHTVLVSFAAFEHDTGKEDIGLLEVNAEVFEVFHEGPIAHAPVYSSPIVVDSIAYIADIEGNVYAYDLEWPANDGPMLARLIAYIERGGARLLWKHQIPEPVHGALHFYDDTLYVATGTGKVYVFHSEE